MSGLTGEALDRAVAEALGFEPYGWTYRARHRHQGATWGPWYTPQHREDAAEDVRVSKLDGMVTEGPVEAFGPYSTDPAAFARLRDAAFEKGLGWVVAAPHGDEGGYMALPVSCSTDDLERREGVIIAEGVPGFGRSPEEAGCRAIVAAKKAKEKR